MKPLTLEYTVTASGRFVVDEDMLQTLARSEQTEAEIADYLEDGVWEDAAAQNYADSNIDDIVAAIVQMREAEQESDE